jgi:mRNA-degrading endonuclease RelE of RelBE toxin-antitoxin system
MQKRRERSTAYNVEFAESVRGHLRALTPRERASVIDAIERQLRHQPLTETRHRKPLRPNPVAPWELRVQSLRVFYEVAGGEPRQVRILAVGKKHGNALTIGGKEIRL